MNIEKSRLISEAAPHLNAYQGTINGNEFAAIVPVIPVISVGVKPILLAQKRYTKRWAWKRLLYMDH